MLSSLRKLAKDNRGATTIEFVVVFAGFIAIMFFVVEVTLYMFFMASLEKAAAAGVRATVVSQAVAFVPPTIARDPDTGIFGRKCSLGGQCEPFDTITCRGAAPRAGEVLCSSTPFNRILNHMKGFNSGVEADNVTVTYEDVGIGFAGGPTVPMVTVTVAEVPYQTGILSLLLGPGPGGAGVLGMLPSRSASMTGESLGL